MKFTIDRRKWVCGEFGPEPAGIGETAMLNDQGFMCCLGHVARQLGADESDFDGAYYPNEVVSDADLSLLRTYDKGSCINTDFSQAAARINDTADIATRVERETALIKCFAEHGHDLTFTGEYVTEETAPCSST